MLKIALAGDPTDAFGVSMCAGVPVAVVIFYVEIVLNPTHDAKLNKARLDDFLSFFGVVRRTVQK